MGKAVPSVIKLRAHQLKQAYPESFGKDFDSNKKAIRELNLPFSKTEQNLMAGYLSRISVSPKTEPSPSPKLKPAAAPSPKAEPQVAPTPSSKDEQAIPTSKKPKAETPAPQKPRPEPTASTKQEEESAPSPKTEPAEAAKDKPSTSPKAESA